MKSVSFRDWPIARKLNMVIFVVSAVLFTGMTVFMSQYVARVLKEDGLVNLSRITQMDIDMIDVYGQSLRTSISALGGSFSSNFSDQFALDPMATTVVGEVQAPLLRNGKSVVNMDFTAVDRFNAATGGIATVFARKGNDFIRVTTSRHQRHTGCSGLDGAGVLRHQPLGKPTCRAGSACRQPFVRRRPYSAHRV